jgi:PRC-barrel domain protein
MDHPRSWMRYVAADDLDEGPLDFDGLEVDGIDGKKLGKVDGFIVDISSGRPYYIVVDGGGWFRSKFFLLPVGHAQLDEERKILVSDLTRDRVENFPGFDKAEFDRLSEDEITRLAARIAMTCCADETVYIDRSWIEQSHYRQPDWWETGYYRPERMVTSDRRGS